MKILHIIPNLEIGGAEIMLMRLIKQWNEDSEVSCAVVCLDGGGPLLEEIQQQDVKVFTLPDLQGFRLFALLKIVRDIRPDIIQTWMYRADLVGLLVSLLTRQGGVVWNIRCSVGWAERGVAHWIVFGLLRVVSSMPNAVVSNASRSIIEHCEAGYRSKRWVRIPNGFDTDMYRPRKAAFRELRDELGVYPSTPIIGMVARFDPLKDHKTFLRAACRLVKINDYVHFVLIGAGLRENISILIQELGLEERVHILGFRGDVAMILPGFDIATLSSSSEGFPNVIGEAMSCGLPCIATRVSDLPDLLGDEWLVEPHDDKALSEAWSRLLSLSRKQRSAIGERNRRRILRHFSIEVVAKQYISLYKNVLSVAGE